MDTRSEDQAGEFTASQEIPRLLTGQIEEIDHVAIAVVDLDAAIDWYVNVLGFRVIERRKTHGERTSMLSAQLVSGGACVVLVQGSSPDSQVSRFIEKFGPGVHHIAFRVAELDGALQQMARAGRSPETALIEDVGLRQAFLCRESGSGVRVELIERRGGDFSDRSVEQLFREFESRGIY